MLAPIEWLQSFTKLPKDLALLCQGLTLSGSKVEGLTGPASFLSGVVTGQINKIERHPDADKLVVCTIDVGKDEPLQIVTGATNVAEGQIVPVACDGSVLAEGVKIKTGKLRGVTSQGMLCSLAELGLSTTLFPEGAVDGIFILSPDCPVGQPILEALDCADPVVEFEITSNRPDCFSIEGLAREAAITFGESFQPVAPLVKGDPAISTAQHLQVENLAPDLCLRYCARRIEDVRIEPAPFWMRRRLELSGIRSINNLVDITNYVLLELGQPLHAFSAEKITNGKIQVRRAQAGERVETLDETERKLSGEDLVIADSDKVLALAGIMGGEESGIHQETKTVVLESANFLANCVRDTAYRLGIRSESSARFERTLDPNLCLRALNRACELIETLGCGRVAEDWIDTHPLAFSSEPLLLQSERINQALGTSIEDSWMEKKLEEIGCTLEAVEDSASTKVWKVTPPTWRPDLEGFADYVEEIARFYDYNRIPATLLPVAETTVGGRSMEQHQGRMIRQIACSLGYYEAYTYSFMSPKDLDLLGLPEESPLRNCLRIRRAPEDTSCLRTTPLPSLLQCLKHNAVRSLPAARLFELMRTYHPNPDGGLPCEQKVLAAVLYDREQETPSGGERFYELKHLVEEIVEQLGVKSLKFLSPIEGKGVQAPLDSPCFHPYRSTWISVRNQVVGVMGYLHPNVTEAYELPRQTAALILNGGAFFAAANMTRKQKPLPKYPATTRDLAILVDRQIPVGEIESILVKQGGKLLESVRLFDVYEGKNIPEGKKSVAYSLQFRSAKGTLQDGDVNPVMEQILTALEKKLDARLRR